MQGRTSAPAAETRRLMRGWDKWGQTPCHTGKYTGEASSMGDAVSETQTHEQRPDGVLTTVLVDVGVLT